MSGSQVFKKETDIEIEGVCMRIKKFDMTRLAQVKDEVISVLGDELAQMMSFIVEGVSSGIDENGNMSHEKIQEILGMGSSASSAIAKKLGVFVDFLKKTDANTLLNICCGKNGEGGYNTSDCRTGIFSNVTYKKGAEWFPFDFNNTLSCLESIYSLMMEVIVLNYPHFFSFMQMSQSGT